MSNKPKRRTFVSFTLIDLLLLVASASSMGYGLAYVLPQILG